MWKVKQVCIGFGLHGLLHSMIGPENLDHSLNQSNAKLTPITTSSPAFSCSLGRLLVFTFGSHWLFNLLSHLLIGRCNYFCRTVRLKRRKFPIKPNYNNNIISHRYWANPWRDCFSLKLLSPAQASL